ncbi:unnamed protein product [marine sediment metagenome]|uniref:Uncharacterized protein n=1 Tax=marine sediment metagenome TaxID=412755 RepID=X1G673_9ZZZZ
MREMGKNFIARDFPILDDADIIFKVETFESIHPYNVYCELKRKYVELKNKYL